jgi:hypothetical protein
VYAQDTNVIKILRVKDKLYTGKDKTYKVDGRKIKVHLTFISCASQCKPSPAACALQ